MQDNLVIIDLETTGLFEEGKVPEIIEIGAVKITGGLGDTSTLSYITKPFTEPTKDYWCGITKEEAMDGLDLKEALSQLRDFCGGKNALLAAWPISFEMPILQYWYANCGWKSFPLDRRAIDIGSLARQHLNKNSIDIVKHPDASDDGYSCINVANTLGSTIYTPKHRALPDALTETRVLLQCL